MLRELRARVLIDAKAALETLKRLGISFDELKEKIEKIPKAVDEAKEKLAEVGEKGQAAGKKTEEAFSAALGAIEKYRYHLLAIGAAFSGITAIAIKEAAIVEAETSRLAFFLGDYFSDVMQWIDAFTDRFGYSTETITTSFGDLVSVLVSQNVPMRKAIQIAEDLMERAADIAASRRMDMESVMAAFTAALSGYPRGLVRTLKIYLTHPDLQRIAYQLYRTSYEALQPAQRALVTYKGIMQATAATAGYAAEHLEITTVAVRRLREEMSDFLRVIGETWLGTIGPLADALTNFLRTLQQHPGLLRFLSVIIAITGGLFTLLGKIGMFLFYLKMLKEMLPGVYKHLAKLFSLPKAPFDALISGLQKAFKRFKDSRLFEWLVEYLDKIGKALSSFFYRLGREVYSQLGKLAKLLKDVFSVVLAHTATFVASLIKYFKKLMATIAGGLSAFLASPWGILITVLAAIGTALYFLIRRFGGFRNFITRIAEDFRMIGAKLRAFYGLVVQAGRSLAGAFTALGAKVREVFQKVMDWVFDKLRALAAPFVKAGQVVVNFLVNVSEKIRGLWTSLSSFIMNIGQTIKNAFQAISNWFLAKLNAFIRSALDVLRRVFGWVPGLGSAIQSAIESFDPVMPLIQKIRSSEPALAAELERIANIVRERRPDLRGAELMEAFLLEIERSAPDLREALEKYLTPAQEYLEAKSPPKAGPLHEIPRWGQAVASEFASAFGAGLTSLEGILEDKLGELREIRVKAPTLPELTAKVVPVFKALPKAVPITLPEVKAAVPALPRPPVLEKATPVVVNVSPPSIPPLYLGKPGVPIAPGITRKETHLPVNVEVVIHNVTISSPGAPGTPVFAPEQISRELGRNLSEIIRREVGEYLVRILRTEETLHMKDEAAL